MDAQDNSWKIFVMYALIIIFVLFTSVLSGQISVVQFNAEWNKSNEVIWVMDLEDCSTMSYADISDNPNMAKKHKIAVIPTIIVFKDNLEVARFQADLSFKMVATRKEVQEEINNQLMSDF